MKFGACMKFVTFAATGEDRLGVLRGAEIVDLTSSGRPAFSSMLALLNGGPEAMRVARELAESAAGRYQLADVTLRAPVPRPGKYLALGLNYRRHALEAERKGVKIPKHQVWFNKQITCINGPYADIHLPRVSDKLDYEAELALVIGRRCRHVAAEDATEVIAGYTIANDVSVRDWQMRAQTWTLGKSFDTHGPLGPALVTQGEVGDPHDLNIRCLVNGQERQSANTADMIYRVGDMIAHLSAAMTLEPGDVLATGTPSGIGSAMEPPQYLRAGDVVRIEIDRLGYIEHTVIEEPASA